MSKKKIKTVSAEELIKHFTMSFALNADELFVDHEDKYLSGKYKNYVGASFIRDLISVMVSRVLNDIPEGMTNNQEQYEHVQAGFARLKVQLQDAIAKGMGSAMSTWSERECDYYCQIKPHPTMLSKQEN